MTNPDANLFVATRTCRACCDNDRCNRGSFSSSPEHRERISRRPRDVPEFVETSRPPPTNTHARTHARTHTHKHTLSEFYSNNATNLHHLTTHSTTCCPTKRRSHCDHIYVTSLHRMYYCCVPFKSWTREHEFTTWMERSIRLRGWTDLELCPVERKTDNIVTWSIHVVQNGHHWRSLYVAVNYTHTGPHCASNNFNLLGLPVPSYQPFLSRAQHSA